MTYLNNEKHETFLTHAIIQEGRFFITYADHGDCGSSRLLKRLVSSKKQRCFWEYGPRINFARTHQSIQLFTDTEANKRRISHSTSMLFCMQEFEEPLLLILKKQKLSWINVDFNMSYSVVEKIYKHDYAATLRIPWPSMAGYFYFKNGKRILFAFKKSKVLDEIVLHFENSDVILTDGHC